MYPKVDADNGGFDGDGGNKSNTESTKTTSTADSFIREIRGKERNFSQNGRHGAYGESRYEYGGGVPHSAPPVGAAVVEHVSRRWRLENDVARYSECGGGLALASIDLFASSVSKM